MLKEYYELINTTLFKLCSKFEKIKDADVNIQEGQLQCKIKGIGEYLFNRQPSTTQLWVSSPLTGPFKFDIVNGKWFDPKHNVSFKLYIEKEFEKIKQKIK